jgi:hypothetical protein
VRKYVVLMVTLVASVVLSAPAGAITNGTPDGNGHPGAGALFADLGRGPEPVCSGVLVGPNVFLTAAHCIVGLPSVAVWASFDSALGSSPSLVPGLATFDPAYDGAKRPGHDLGVVVLAHSVAGAVPLPPLGLLDRVDKSAAFTNVGYGYYERVTGNGSPTFSYDGLRRVSTSSFQKVDENLLWLSSANGGVCFGDSGGPRYLGSVVAALTSGGNKSCTSPSWSTRLDTAPARAFLGQFVPLP